MRFFQSSSSLTTLALGAAILPQLVLAVPAPQPPHDHTNPNEQANIEHTLVMHMSHQSHGDHDHDHDHHNLDNHRWSHNFAHPELEWSLDEKTLEALNMKPHHHHNDKDKDHKSKSTDPNRGKGNGRGRGGGRPKTTKPTNPTTVIEHKAGMSVLDEVVDVLEYIDHQASRVIEFLTNSPLPTAVLQAGLPAAPTKTMPVKSWDIEDEEEHQADAEEPSSSISHDFGGLTEEEKQHIIKQIQIHRPSSSSSSRTRTRARPQKTNAPGAHVEHAQKQKPIASEEI
ncbi:hypothetical protein L228DRAFT_175614 [Xylona heveae TC161]|uniref:Uncharacterized protein n=1 Tax=Xylona heveae (strain CBS 132557 / TC161) TaxID=1328760 RepID=A0A165AKB1_XYLHT|nr:hypothetical protein L228DRAFT_175614 [Xylona heveae TC161]KZF20624.1 hypothetical protein L228DRAFT_175614 [Xylona heveae TC161]